MAQKRMVKVFRNNGKPIRFLKFQRNEQCLCMSGKKFKHCHIGKEKELIELLNARLESLETQKEDEQASV